MVETLYILTCYIGQKAKEETETMQENTHPTNKTPQNRGVDATIRTQSTTGSEICHHQSTTIILKKALIIPKCETKEKSLKPTL